MKQGWELKKIQDITKVINGYAFPSKDFQSIKSIKITNVGVKEFVEIKGNYLPEKYKSTLQNYQVKEGNIVIALTRTIIAAGLKVAIVPYSYDGAFLNQRVAALIPNERLISQRYLYNYLTTDDVKKYVLAKVNTLMQPNLSINDLRNLLIPLPSLLQQKRIVTILDEAFAGISLAVANAEKNLANARELFESYLNNVFTQKGDGWKDALMSDFFDVRDGTHDSPRYVEEGIPFVTQKNIREDGLSFEKTKFISESDHEKFYKRSNVFKGDILISMIGANRGMVCLVDDNRVFSIKNVGLIKSNSKVNMSLLL